MSGRVREGAATAALRAGPRTEETRSPPVTPAGRADREDAVETPDDDELRSLDEIQREIRRELDRIEFDLAPIFDGGALEDANESVERFEAAAGRLEQNLSDLGRALSGLEAVAPLDLSRTAARILQDVLLDLEKPLVLHVDWAEGLPQPTVSGEPLRSLLTRILGLVGRFAHPGDAVRVATVADGDDVLFRVTISACDPRTAQDTRDQLRLRAGTLEEFVADIGGRFGLAEHEGVSRLEVRLPLVARKR